MAKTAIAVIVAGSGEVSQAEIADLINDVYPEEEYDLDLLVPVEKTYFTATVGNAADVLALEDGSNIYPFKTTGASMTRAAASLGEGTQELDNILDIFADKDSDFKDWDDVLFLVALPDPEDEIEYERYAEWVEAAIEGGFTVKNLAAGLDDVVLEEPAEDEPEPEEEKTREQEFDVEAALEEGLESKKDASAVIVPGEHIITKAAVAEALETLSLIADFFEKVDETNAMINLSEVEYRPLTKQARKAVNALEDSIKGGEPTEAPEEPEEPAQAPGRGRGRPRTNFEIKEVYDEDEEAWVDRPKGRMKKGTKWRVRHAETDDILDEGTA